MGVQRDVGGIRVSPLILLGPAQRAACWNIYRHAAEVYQQRNAQPVEIEEEILSILYQNRNCRLRLRSDSRLSLRFALRKRWAAAQTRLGISSPAPFFASRLSKQFP